MNDVPRYRVVLDTNQIVAAGSAWLNRNPPVPVSSAQRLVHTVATLHTGLLCGDIAGEYVAKLYDNGHPRERIIKFVGLIIGCFERVEITSRQCNPEPPDKDDIVFILCAIDGSAHLLVTEDKHLLDLKNSYTRFRIVRRSDAAKTLGC